MRQLTEDDVAAPPLPQGRAAEAWNSYLMLALQGIRVPARAAVHRFVDALMDSNPDTRTGFANWLCTLVFDESDFWAGQWGGD